MANPIISRRAFTRALATLSAIGTPALASAALGAENDREAEMNMLTTITPVNGIDCFARTWLTRWTAKGGSVILDRNDPSNAWFGRPEYDRSPVARIDQERRERKLWPETLGAEAIRAIQTQDVIYCANRYDGAMKEAYEMLLETLGAVEAIKALVAAKPALGLPAN